MYSHCVSSSSCRLRSLTRASRRSIEELQAPGFRRNHSMDILQQRAIEKEREREMKERGARARARMRGPNRVRCSFVRRIQLSPLMRLYSVALGCFAGLGSVR